MATIRIWETYTQQNPETYDAIPLPVTGGVSDIIYCPFCRDLFITADVVGMSSGETVTGRVEGSLDGLGWDNMAADGEDTIITENGTTLLTYSGALPPYIRATGISTTVEGTDASITLQFHIARMA